MFAVSNIIHNIEDKYWFVIVRHAYNNIEVFGYTNTDFMISEHSHSPFDILRQQLKSILNLDVSITQLRTYENIFSLLNKSEKSEIEIYTEENSIIDMVNKFIHENYKKPISTQHAAKYVSFSTAYFCIYYKQHTDENFLDSLNRYRIQKAIEILNSANIEKLSTLHAQVGFPNKSYFYRLFRQHTGLTPTQYINSKKENKGE